MSARQPVNRWIDEAIKAAKAAAQAGGGADAASCPGSGTGNEAGGAFGPALRSPAALATVVATRGSTPREAGARMIVYPDGSIWGTVGGGCGEAEVRRAALDVIESGRPRLLTIDLSGFFGDEHEVCGGRMEVFVEPLGPRKAPEGFPRAEESRDPGSPKEPGGRGGPVGR